MSHTANSELTEVAPSTVTDDKGRPIVEGMTDRELLEEMVRTARQTQDLVIGFIEHMSQGGMGGMVGGLMRMMGK